MEGGRNMPPSSSTAFSLDHLTSSPSEQLCYVHCNFCDTVLAVSVPCSSLFKTVTVRCGHCTNLLSVNMRTLLFPAPTQIQFGHHSLLAPTHSNLLDEIMCPPPVLDPPCVHKEQLMVPAKRSEMEVSQTAPMVNRPPEKRQRVPSAYNRFIKDEIQRIKAGNPDITHREAFSAAAKNWAHFPHIHFGLMSDYGLKKSNIRQQEGDDMAPIKDGFYAAAAAAAANIGITPF